MTDISKGVALLDEMRPGVPAAEASARIAATGFPQFTPRILPGRFLFAAPLVAPRRLLAKRRERRAPALGRRR